LAVVANNGDHSVSIVDLSLSPPALTMTLTSDIDFYPYAVGVNPLTGQALVVYQNSSKATIIDLNSLTVTGTSQITTTGPNPQVAIEPRLNWGIVTPGGSGSISIVSLSGQGRNVAALIAVPSSNGAKRSGGTVTITTTSAHRLSRDQEVVIAGVDDPSFNGTFTVESVPSSVTFTYTQSGPDETSGNGTVSAAAPLVTVALSSNIRGISINTETERAVLADPSSNSLTFMSALDQTVSTLALETGAVASAVNPLTNIAVTINSISNQASIIDLRTPRRLGTAIVGNNPQAVAIDPVTNVAVVANQSSNTVTLIHLGTIRSLHVTQMSPLTTLTTASDLTLTLLGNGFVSGSVVRLSEIPLQTTFVNARKLTAIVPASKLAAPHRYIIDVVNPDQSVSNVNDFVVMQAIPVGTAPRGVAIDPERDIAVVTNTGSDTVSVINLNNRSILGTLRVGDSPQGVAVLSRAGRAAVTNTDDDSVSIIDLDNIAVSATISVAPSSGTAKPIGVAIHPGSGKAVIANSNSSQVSFLNVQSPGTPTTLTVDTGPIAVAIDPTRNLAAVAHGSQSNVVIVDLDDEQIETRVTGFQLPTGAVYDPDSDQFVVASSLANNLVLIDPDSFAVTSVRVGINPTSVDSNYRSSTLVTANTSSQTVSVMNFPARTVEAILPLPVSQQFAIAVHPRTNQAVVVDQNNNRVLLVPLPK
jgi:YVTN family beta-propeller protein